jgi:hypothetical protein
MGILMLGWDRPLGGGGASGWDWWTLAGTVLLFVLLETGRHRPPLPLAIVLAAIGGLVLAELTDAWGVMPVWGALLIVVLTRNLLRGRDRPRFDRPSGGGAQ